MIHVAIPAMDEPGLPDCLLALNRQRLLPATVCVCINQPASYYHDGFAEHARICAVNRTVYEQLQRMKTESRFLFDLEIIDRFSPQNAWDTKHFGVGWARKTAMDFLSERLSLSGNAESGRSALIACMDADTVYPDTYLEDMRAVFEAYPQAAGLANPYYHPLENRDEAQNKAMLHYEVYMRSYALNMVLSGHPYAFTAVGSSMACTWETYRRIGGISPFKSGEDFYFLQKIAKTGALLTHSASVSFPSGRLSDRVFFGTGPALKKGVACQWGSYPIYPMELFETMRRAYAGLPELFRSDTVCPEMDFWEKSFGPQWWRNIRDHSGGREAQFVRACTEKFDALRSLQFLKSSYVQDNTADWRNLCGLCRSLMDRFSDRLPRAAVLAEAGAGPDGREVRAVFDPDRLASLWQDASLVTLGDLTLPDWNRIRDFLFLCERYLQQRHPLLRS